MFNKTYSEMSLTLTANAMRIIDTELSGDLLENWPDGLPKDNEWQIGGKSIFSNSRKKAAQKRVAFNNGVMSGVAEHFFDGKASELNDFIKKSLLIGIPEGKSVAKNLVKITQKHPEEFALGYRYSKGFITRQILNESNASSDTPDLEDNNISEQQELSTIEKMLQSQSNYKQFSEMEKKIETVKSEKILNENQLKYSDTNLPQKRTLIFWQIGIWLLILIIAAISGSTEALTVAHVGVVAGVLIFLIPIWFKRVFINRSIIWISITLIFLGLFFLGHFSQ